MARTENTPVEPLDPMKELVTLSLPRATGNEPDYELIALNGKQYKIQKGTTVRIPRPVYAIWAESQRNQNKVAEFNNRQADLLAQRQREIFGG